MDIISQKLQNAINNYMRDEDTLMLELIYESLSEVKISNDNDNSAFQDRVKFTLGDAILDLGKSKFWGVVELFVPENMRRQGIASKLLLAADEYLTSEGYRSQVSNDASVKLHYGLGFRAFDNDEELSVDDTIKIREEWSSVMMLSPNFIKNSN